MSESDSTEVATKIVAPNRSSEGASAEGSAPGGEARPEATELGSVGRYRLRRLLGRGGMAEVFLASHDGPAGFHKTVVVKRIRRALSEEPKFVEMFLREARIAARLNHVNTVQIFELGEADGEYFIAMEYLDGVALHTAARRVWQRDESVPMEVILRSMADAAAGLHHAHTLRDDEGRPTPLVHRDISPDNLLLTRDGITKVLDFGIAKSNEVDDVTKTGELKGKVPYMSPEQIRGEALDGRADLFSLGATFYQLLTGERPFQADSELMVLDAVLRSEPRPPRELNPLIPPNVQAVVLRLLAKDREERFESGLALQRAILDVLGPVAATATVSAAAFVEHVATLDTGQPSGNTRGTFRTVMAAQPTTPWLRSGGAHADLDNRLPDKTPAKPRAALPDASSSLLPTRSRVPLLVALGAAAALGVAGVMGLRAPDATLTASVPEAPATKLASVAAADVAAVDQQLKQKAPDPIIEEKGASAAAPPREPTRAARGKAVEAMVAGDEKKQRADEPAQVERPQKAERALASPPRHVEVKAPPGVLWETPEGKRVGRGAGKLSLPGGTEALIAHHVERGARTRVALGEGVIDYDKLPKGRASFRIKPWAKVFLGRELLGTTPLAPVTLVAGRYAVRLEWEGRVREEVLVVEPGRQAVLKADMREAPAAER